LTDKSVVGPTDCCLDFCELVSHRYTAMHRYTRTVIHVEQKHYMWYT